MIDSISVDIDFNYFLQADFDKNEGSCIKHQVDELKDIHDRFGGMPSTYEYANTKIHQVWFDETQLDYNDLGSKLNMEVVTVSAIKQPPGCVIPLHRDTFYQITKKFPNRKDPKVRANIYLEDWKAGHFVQYNDTVSTHWKKGEGFMWDSSVEHLGANAGMQPKYTLQISGFLI
jgi:hypothetical protein